MLTWMEQLAQLIQETQILFKQIKEEDSPFVCVEKLKPAEASPVAVISTPFPSPKEVKKQPKKNPPLDNLSSLAPPPQADTAPSVIEKPQMPLTKAPLPSSSWMLESPPAIAEISMGEIKALFTKVAPKCTIHENIPPDRGQLKKMPFCLFNFTKRRAASIISR